MRSACDHVTRTFCATCCAYSCRFAGLVGAAAAAGALASPRHSAINMARYGASRGRQIVILAAMAGCGPRQPYLQLGGRIRTDTTMLEMSCRTYHRQHDLAEGRAWSHRKMSGVIASIGCSFITVRRWSPWTPSP